MRVLLTGASGVLGTWLLRTAPADVAVVAVVHTGQAATSDTVRVDLRDADATAAMIDAVAPDLVLHAAYRRDRDSVVAATANVAAAASRLGSRTLVLSSEAVFSGDGHPRAEDDPPDPVWDYGRWKSAAERLAVRHNPTATVVRAPLMVSLDPPDGTTASVASAAARGEPLGWYAGERRQPAYASEVAAALWQLTRLPPDRAAGTWHLPGAERLTRSELGTRIAGALGVDDPGVETAAPSPDERPHDLHLTGQRAQDELAWNPTAILP